MSRLLLLLILLSPTVISSEPSVDQLLRAYARAGWFQAVDKDGVINVCISQRGSDFADHAVRLIGERAKGLTCS